MAIKRATAAWRASTVLSLVLVLSLGSCSSDEQSDVVEGEEDASTPTETEQACFCPDGTENEQSRSTDGEGWEACDCVYYGIWCDPDTELCWQDPQKDPGHDDIGVTSQDAKAYCGALVFGGYDDWRVADIDELRTLVKGNAATAVGGTCPVTAGSKMADSQQASCLGADEMGGPGGGGCYWDPALTGTCDKADPAAQGHHLEYWASDAAVDDPEHWIAYVSFDNAAVGFNHVNSYGDVRCVREGPSPAVECAAGDATQCEPGDTRKCECAAEQEGAQVCAADGKCFGPCECTGFVPSEAPTDACPSCDSLEVTIRVPEKLSGAPHELMAFLYNAQGYEFPPMRPPDGGNSENQVIDPDIDLDRPYLMTVPGCTYYRENCLAGEHFLFVALYMEERWPPIPAEGDYWWGIDAASIAFPFDGADHAQSVTKMDITLSPVSQTACPADKPVQCTDGSCVATEEECCPEATPHRCADGRCVADPAECSTGEECSPDDSEVVSCRYKSLFIEDNCADFPMAAGWTAVEVDGFCKAQQGADAATVVVVQGDSCLKEKGSLAGVTRCAANDAGRPWYAYNAPSFVCGSFLGGIFENGPFCDPY